jgi:hypothetical protein
MKKLTTTLAIIAILLLSFTSCDKYHRDRYIGTWDFVTTKTLLQYDSGKYVPIESDTIYYTGKIIPENLEYELIIQFTEDEEIRTSLTKEGELWQSYPTSYHTCAKCPLGSFEKKNIIGLHFYTFGLPSSDEYIKTYDINGTKRKKGGKYE